MSTSGRGQPRTDYQNMNADQLREVIAVLATKAQLHDSLQEHIKNTSKTNPNAAKLGLVSDLSSQCEQLKIQIRELMGENGALQKQIKSLAAVESKTEPLQDDLNLKLREEINRLKIQAGKDNDSQLALHRNNADLQKAVETLTQKKNELEQERNKLKIMSEAFIGKEVNTSTTIESLQKEKKELIEENGRLLDRQHEKDEEIKRLEQKLSKEQKSSSENNALVVKLNNSLTGNFGKLKKLFKSLNRMSYTTSGLVGLAGAALTFLALLALSGPVGWTVFGIGVALFCIGAGTAYINGVHKACGNNPVIVAEKNIMSSNSALLSKGLQGNGQYPTLETKADNLLTTSPVASNQNNNSANNKQQTVANKSNLNPFTL